MAMPLIDAATSAAAAKPVATSAAARASPCRPAARRQPSAAFRHAGRHARRCPPSLLAWAAPQQPSAAASSVAARATGAAAGELSLEEQDRLCEELTAFLRQDLQHLFDDQGIDASKYDERVDFVDPITKYDSLNGYKFNIAMLRHVFSPTFTLHDIRRTGPLELTTRWTMTMCLSFARSSPLRGLFDPKLTFTGTSIMTINPQTRRFCRHEDTWDAVEQQGFFSVEAFVHMLSQVLDLRRGPDDSPPAVASNGSSAPAAAGSAAAAAAAGQYEVLLKRKRYEVRKYASLPAAAVTLPGGSSGASGASAGGSGGVYAVGEFGGAAEGSAAQQAEQALRRALLEEGQDPAAGGWLLAAPADAGPALLRRNEVLVPLKTFQLW